MTITQAVTLQSRDDLFQNSSQTYTLSATPAAGATVDVFVNGLLMTEGLDYTLSGAALTFTGQTIGDNPVIRVRYWV
ncbi:MAG: hypothetical protein ABSB88_06090 [Bryobacteraceae bacterium]|jgi:hypothetical protein